MATRHYLKLCKEAQNKKIELSKKQENEIRQIYKDMYENVSKNIKNSTKGTLNERYLEELKKYLEKEIISTSNRIKKTIKDNIKKSSELANNVQLDFFMQINNEYSLNLKETFISMFSKIPESAMNEILFGTAYKDRKGLSERIWLDTKKFNKDVDYIVSQGIANKKSAFDIAKDLEVYVNPDAKKSWEWKKVYPKSNKKIDYNAQRLARTSVNHAFQQSQIRSCEKNPYVEGIKWLASNTHRTCKLCNSRNGQIYKINEVPLDHPNGLCTTIPEILMSLESIGSELREWIDGEKNIKLDTWFEEHGLDFI